MIGKPEIDVHVCSGKKLSLDLEGEYFIGDSQRKLSGKWQVSILDNKIQVEDDKEVILSSSEIKLIPIGIDCCGFTIYPCNSKKTQAQRKYRGAVLLTFVEGTVQVWNEVDIEWFVTSVLCNKYSEFDSLEFLKLQALIARSSAFILSKDNVSADKQINHESLYNRFSLAPHELKSLYLGVPEKCNEVAHKAVAETEGNILVFDDQVCIVPQTICCGGITEGDIDMKFLNRVCDSDHFTNIDLTQAGYFEQWYYRPIECYCDKDKSKLGSWFDNEIKGISHLFRWTKTLASVEISSVLRNSFDMNIGSVESIDILERGSSGAVLKMRIKGNIESIEMTGADSQAFCEELGLQSSAFLVERKTLNKKLSFVFSGAGTGLGKGICIAGALELAQNKKTAEQILAHYLPLVLVEKQY